MGTTYSSNYLFKNMTFAESKKLTKSLMSSLIILVLIYVLITFIVMTVLCSPTGVNPTADLLNDGVFYNREGSNSMQTVFMVEVARNILVWVLPFMSVFGLAMMLLQASSTAIYFSKSSFFDSVHEQHLMRKKKDGDGGKNGLFRVVNHFKTMGTVSFLKAYIVPDFKQWSLDGAAEEGEDGQVSIGNFVKTKLPKHMVITALIIIINDRTLLDLINKGGTFITHFVSKATYDVDYIGKVEGLLNLGGRYNPGFKGTKKNLYDKCYNILLDVDKAEYTQNKEYKQSVGLKLASWIDYEFSTVDFENSNVVSTVSLVTNENAIPLQTKANKKIADIWEEFNVKSGDSGVLYSLAVDYDIIPKVKHSLSIRNNSMRTDFPAAWSGDGESTDVVFDISKTSAWQKQVPISASNFKFNVKQVKYVMGGSDSIVTYTTSDDGKITIKASDLQPIREEKGKSQKLNSITITFSYYECNSEGNPIGSSTQMTASKVFNAVEYVIETPITN